MSDIVAFSPVRAIDRNGKSVSGALATFFASGTTTPVTVYSDVDEAVPHASPLVADSRGVFPPVYRGGIVLRVVVTDPEGVTLPGFPIDPAITVSALGSGASEISFAPTGDIPATNVQAAIERVQANLVAPLLAGGIGVTGTNTLLGNLNATDTASGFYRFNDTTTGDRPTGWDSSDTGVVSFLRENSNSGLMEAIRRGDAGKWHRRLNAGTWAAWVRVVDSGQEQAQSVWNTGTATAESTISPAKLEAKLDDYEQQIGVGQTWQTVSRVGSTSYQNTTNKPIMVNIDQNAGGSRDVQASADDSTWVNVGGLSGASRTSCQFIVPVGWYYRVNGSLGTYTWTELR